jgi:serine/threonine protein kinase
MSIGPRSLDKYELRQRLGRGGMAEVWKALDTQLQRYVAIKILHADLQQDPSFTARFEREAQLIASLHHPNIVQVYDFRIAHPPEVEEVMAYMVMDYVEGTTLARYLTNTSRTGKFPPPSDIVQLFTPVCEAVDYAHKQGMIHRDLKPANILLDRRSSSHQSIGEPILSDFGIAKLLGDSLTTRSGWWLGTPYYMSPEQAKGAPGNERSDIYALGVILYELCVGMLPFQGENPTSIIMQQINADPIPPALINPNVSPALSAVILCSLAKMPTDRFSSASTFGIALAESLQQPVPPSLRLLAHQMQETDNSTFVSPIPSEIARSASPQSGTPPPSFSTWRSPQPASGPFSTPPAGENVGYSSGQPAKQTVGNSIAFINGTSSFDLHSPSTASPPSLTPIPSGLPRPERTRRRRVIITLLIVLVLVGASMSTLLLLTHNTPPSSPTNNVVGNAFFISSGQLNQDNSQGINDQVQIDLHNIPDPPPGKAYYAWLLADRVLNEFMMTPLGQLRVDSGNVHLFYEGTAQHTNLLAIRSRILITQEDANVQPSIYSPDYSNWIYYAQLPQAASPKDKLHFSMLDHMRHLLSESPELQIRGLHGGLDMWFLRNTQKILEWSSAARDSWRNAPDLLHRQIIRILDYLDGKDHVQADLRAGDPVMLADPLAAQIPLLGPDPNDQDPPGYNFSNESPPGYVYLVASHLGGTVLSPDATADQRDLAARVQVGIDQVRGWLEQAHLDAKQLIMMNNKQLAQPQALSLLNDLVASAQYAYTGKVDPLTGQLQGGVIWVCSNIQRMANFELKPFQLQTYQP